MKRCHSHSHQFLYYSLLHFSHFNYHECFFLDLYSPLLPPMIARNGRRMVIEQRKIRWKIEIGNSDQEVFGSHFHHFHPLLNFSLHTSVYLVHISLCRFPAITFCCYPLFPLAAAVAWNVITKEWEREREDGGRKASSLQVVKYRSHERGDNSFCWSVIPDEEEDDDEWMRNQNKIIICPPSIPYSHSCCHSSHQFFLFAIVTIQRYFESAGCWDNEKKSHPGERFILSHQLLAHPMLAPTSFISFWRSCDKRF